MKHSNKYIPFNKKSEVIKLALIVILLLVCVRLFVFKTHSVSYVGMRETLPEGDKLLINTISYTFEKPKAGDLVLIHHPFDFENDLIRRVVAVEGDIIHIKNKVLYVNSEPILEPIGVEYADQRILPEEISFRDNIGPMQVPSGTVFVMSDNRDVAEDSRIWGVININDIIGKVDLILYSFEPIPNPPEFKSPYILPLFKIIYNNTVRFPSRLRWDRIAVDV
ncbi:MAG: signal peptidase I [candidate division Zixibacteria bacterium]|nr:signal peptidase I [candidate division Zixibacteria bacterium]